MSFITYSIGIVDIGMKPVSKIESKYRLEDEICSLAAFGKSVDKEKY